MATSQNEAFPLAGLLPDVMAQYLSKPDIQSWILAMSKKMASIFFCGRRITYPANDSSSELWGNQPFGFKPVAEANSIGSRCRFQLLFKLWINAHMEWWRFSCTPGLAISY
jgi:hypothetical protein